VAFAAVVVLEKLVVYCGGVYAGGEEISSVLVEETTAVELGVSVEGSGAEEAASDEDATSDVESAALLAESTLDEGKLEGALEGGKLEGALEGGELEGADISLLDSGGLDRDGDSLLEGSTEELGGLPELLEGVATTVVGSPVEVTTVGSRVTVGVSTDRIVDWGGADAVETIVDWGGAGLVETIVVGAACDSVDVTISERAGTFRVAVSNESRDAKEVTVPTGVDVPTGSPPTIGSQAPELIDWPSCSVTEGLEFR
jgi:hypothetical protein